ncbi:MAG: transglycosylase domain-containing protein [Capsulimonadaceae bacterium]
MASTRLPRNPAPTGTSRPVPPPPERRRSPQRRRTVWDTIGSFIQLVILFGLILIIAGLTYVFLMIRQLPKTVDLSFNPPGVTMIYSSDGVPLAKYFVENRQQVSIDQIPVDLQHATVAFEDRRFYQHHGIDFTGIGRAIVSNFRHGDMHGEGASTITQQLARNLGVDGLTREKSIQRKIKEWLVANQIEHDKSKQEILEMYLNEINYGSGAYGVQAAAKTYFGKDVWDLDLAQCALLAGLPNRPSYYNPYRDIDAAERQRNLVLDWMLEEHYISPEQCEQAKGETIKLASRHEPKLGSQIYHAPYFVEYVFQQLKSDFGSANLRAGNLRVYTTLNMDLQRAAEDAVREQLAAAPAGGPTDACLVALDPKTGAIKAMVGGADYTKSQFNIVTQARRQPGSLFKAILYSSAIDSGLVTEYTTVPDVPITFHMDDGKSWTPKDDTFYSYRRVTLREALAQSINVPAVRTMNLIKPHTVIQYARLMGIDSPLDPVLSLALGSSAVTPLEITSAYSTFDNGGNHADPMAYTEIDGVDGTPVSKVQPTITEHVIGGDSDQQIDDMLQAVVHEGTGAGANIVPNARGKTGTTQEHKDVWFVGYTPDLVCGVWGGHPIHDPKTGRDLYGDSMTGTTWGATFCVPMWSKFMLKAEAILAAEEAKAKPKTTVTSGSTSGQDDDSDDNNSEVSPPVTHAARPVTEKAPAQPAQPSYITHNGDGTVTVNIDNATGLAAPPGAPNSQPVTFAEGTEPTQLAPQYQNGGKGSGSQSTPSNNGDTQSGSSSGDSGQGSGNAAGGDSDPDYQATSIGQGGISPPANSAWSGNSGGANAGGGNSSAGGAATAATAAPAAPPTHRRPAPGAPRHVDTVTVLINPDDGLLATKWTPEKVEKTFVKGTEPHEYSTMYPPPPGEH